MEHSVDLSAKTLVQAVSPSSSRKILKKMKRALQTVGDDNSGTFDLDNLDTHLADINFDDDSDEGNESGNEEEDELEELHAADSVGKALLLVKQVCRLRLV
jgi:Ca2+-binding EF-hand superfamily protein